MLSINCGGLAFNIVPKLFWETSYCHWTKGPLHFFLSSLLSAFRSLMFSTKIPFESTSLLCVHRQMLNRDWKGSNYTAIGINHTRDPLTIHFISRIDVCQTTTYKYSWFSIVLMSYNLVKPSKIMSRKELGENLQNNNESFSVLLVHIIRLNTLKMKPLGIQKTQKN